MEMVAHLSASFLNAISSEVGEPAAPPVRDVSRASGAACTPRGAVTLLVYRPAHDHTLTTTRLVLVAGEEAADAAGLVRRRGRARIVERAAKRLGRRIHTGIGG